MSSRESSFLGGITPAARAPLGPNPELRGVVAREFLPLLSLELMQPLNLPKFISWLRVRLSTIHRFKTKPNSEPKVRTPGPARTAPCCNDHNEGNHDFPLLRICERCPSDRTRRQRPRAAVTMDRKEDILERSTKSSGKSWRLTPT